MYTLALDTTGYKIHLVLLKNDASVYERDWRSNMNEDETITKTIQHLNEVEPFFAQKLTKIIINEGPGTLTGTRVGVAIANALAYATHATIVKLTSQKIWPMRLREEDKQLAPHLLLRITEQELYVDGEMILLKDAVKLITKQIGKGKKRNRYVAYGELTPTQFSELNRIKGFIWIIETDLLTFATVVQAMKEKGDSKLATPRYAKPPVITESKKEPMVVKIRLDGLPDFVTPRSADLSLGGKEKPVQAPKVSAKKPAQKIAQKPAKPAVKKPMVKKAATSPKKVQKKVVKKPVKKVQKKVAPKSVKSKQPLKKKSFSPLRALANKFKSFKNKKR